MRVLTALIFAVSGLAAYAQPADAAPPDWYPPLQWSPAHAANFDAGRGGATIAYIVIHGTDGTYGGTLAWFRDPRADLSAHYVVRASDGEITQVVSEANTAFHARGFNQRSIGVEHEFYPSRGIAYTDAQYRSSAVLVCSIARRYGIPLDRAHILGHNEVPATDHGDPGPSWDWSYYMSLVRACGMPTTVSAFAGDGCVAVLCAPRAGLEAGADGEQVLRLQLALAYLGRLREADLATGPGRFGPRTLAALVSFQRDSGLPTTGYYGDMSAAALARSLARRPPDAPAGDLSYGDESADVAQLQRALGVRGYMSVITGYFGTVTREALRRFQADHGVEPTGGYGSLTKRALALH